MSACVIPIAPEWQNPPAEVNSPPVFIESTPAFGSIGFTTQQLTVVVSDLNVRDNLHVRLVADFPPLDLEVTRVLVPDRPVNAPKDGQILSEQVQLSFACTQLTDQRTTHQLYVIVADRDFVTPIQDPKDVVGDDDEYHINVGSWVFEGCK